MTVCLSNEDQGFANTYTTQANTFTKSITQNSYCTLLWRARVARAYNEGLEAEPTAGSRVRGEVRGLCPLKLKTL